MNPFHKILEEVGFKQVKASIVPTQYNSKGIDAPVMQIQSIWVKE